MPDPLFDDWVAGRYAILWPELFDTAVVDPAVDFLTELAGAGRALEFGIGTGRIAVPLRRRGIRVSGIELSPAMANQLTRTNQHDIDVTIGDFASTKLDRTFQLVYLVRNTITNLTSQDEQVEAFRNAAQHLEPGGCFVIENYIPALRRLPPGQTVHVFTATPTHVGFETYDVAAQVATSHHYWIIDGKLRTFSSPHRYVWPAELDLMARIAGLRLRHRYGDWHRTPFTEDSPSHISVWQKPAERGPNRWLPRADQLLPGPDEPGLVGQHDRLNAVAEAQLGQDPPDVGLDRGLGDEEPLGDLCVGHALGYQQEHLMLAVGQRVHRSIHLPRWRELAGEPVQQPASDARRHHRIARRHDPDRGQEILRRHVLE
jgi:SAM-dependent methyltransferase